MGSNFSGTIVDNDGVHTGGSVALNIVGSAELTLSPTNTYSGGTTVNAGATLNIVSSSCIGTGMLTMSGGNLDNNTGNPVVLGNIPQTWNNGFAYAGASLLNLGTGAVTVASTAGIILNVQSSTGTLEIDGNITSGTASLETTGAGTVVLTGTDTITTPTTTNVATFISNVYSTGTVILNGGNFVTKPNTTFTVAGGLFSATAAAGGAGAAIGNGGTPPSVAYMVVSGGTYQQVNDMFYIGQGSDGVLTIEGSGVVALGTSPLGFSYNGNATTGTGTLQLNGGTLQASGFASLSNVAGQVLNFNGGVLELTANSAYLFGSGTGEANFTSNVQNGMIVNLNGNSTTINGPLVNAGSGGLTVTSANGGTLTVSGSNTYTGATYVEGNSILTLSGTNNYTGGTFVEGNSALIATNAEAILDDTNLYVGSANDVPLFGGAVPAEAGSREISGIAAAATTAVPEPGTLALAAALVSSAVVYRRVRRRTKIELGAWNSDLTTKF